MMNGGMGTRTLELRRESDGYWRCQWVDDAGDRHRKSFGKDKGRARLRFDAFRDRWYNDNTVRNPNSVEHLSIRQAWERYRAYADTYYRHADGSPTGEASNLDAAFRHVRDEFDDLEAAAFDLVALKAVREAMIAAKLARQTINARVNRIRRVFRWFAAEGIVPDSVWSALGCLDPLKPGRSAARCTDPVTPVPEAHIEVAKRELPSVICSMIDVQFWSGARPGEVCTMRPIDLDTSGAVWIYRPVHHKTAHLGRSRVILLGPRAQEAVGAFLRRPVDAWCFAPREGMAERYAARETHRRDDQKPSRARTARRVGDRYTPNTYAQAIARACEAAEIPRWSPNRLRHNAATRVRAAFGLDAAQVVLGHSHADVTQLYAERDLESARGVMARIG